MADSKFGIGFHFTDGKDVGGGLSMVLSNAFDYAQAKSFLERMLINSPDYEKQGTYFVTRAQYERNFWERERNGTRGHRGSDVTKARRERLGRHRYSIEVYVLDGAGGRWTSIGAVAALRIRKALSPGVTQVCGSLSWQSSVATLLSPEDKSN